MSNQNNICGQNVPSLTVAQARQTIAAAINPIQEQEVLPLRKALGRILAQPVKAAINVPGHNNSAMDGFAVRAADLSAAGCQLRIIGDSFAGHPFTDEVASGQCVRIMTGGVMPQGANSIIMQEKVTVKGGFAQISEVVAAGNYVRLAGEDLAQDQVVLQPQRRLTPADLGLLASVGVSEVSVVRKPRIAFFTTGDELTPAGRPLQAGQIYDSNRYTLFGLLTELGFEISDLGIIPDQPQAMQDVLAQAPHYDAMISSGGASVGAADYTVDMLKAVGEVDFWSILVKPGRPISFGNIDKTYFFGLPGNPVSTMVSFIQFVRSALVKLAGGQPAPTLTWQLPITQAISRKAGRQEYQRSKVIQTTNGLTVEPLQHQGSGVLSSMSQADSFIVIPPEASKINKGDKVTVEPFSQPIWR